MIQSIAARDGETSGLAFARNRVDDNPAATAVGVDFDLPFGLSSGTVVNRPLDDVA
jgi:hypothetical protein